ncbi:glycosyltransferase family 4 protein [Altericista sp. CCNU0014]|uniref:glycosyltransferase family 4 protein n=1 Tax=Altericista sp. CCNU0014 TaxID=3082949 RepID=UPI003850858F
MRVAILRRFPKASFSMDVYADRLVDGLKTVRPDWTILEYYPQYSVSGAGAAKGMAGIQKYYERYWRYPHRLKQIEADVFHIIDHSDGDLSRWLRRLGRPNVVTCHDLINLIQPETFKGRARFPLISMTAWRWGIAGMRQADRLITVSSHTKQDVIEHLNIPAQHVTIVPNAVDRAFCRLSPEERQMARDRHSLPPHTFCLLNVGSNNARKNISGILAAIADLKQQGIPIHFWKVGADFTEAQRQFIQTHALTTCVAHLGQPDEQDLIRLYNAADCLMAPSFYEGFGLTILEAMACGTPVITGNVSAMPEVAGDAAILVDPNNRAAIAQAVKQLYSHPEDRQTLAQKGLERVKQFAWENTAEQVACIYEQISFKANTSSPSLPSGLSPHPMPSESTPIDSFR